MVLEEKPSIAVILCSLSGNERSIWEISKIFFPRDVGHLNFFVIIGESFSTSYLTLFSKKAKKFSDLQWPSLLLSTKSNSHVHFSRITSLTGCTILLLLLLLATTTQLTTLPYRYIEVTDHQSKHMTRSFRKFRPQNEPQNEFSKTKTSSHHFTLLCMWAHRKSGAKHHVHI